MVWFILLPEQPDNCRNSMAVSRRLRLGSLWVLSLTGLGTLGSLSSAHCSSSLLKWKWRQDRLLELWWGLNEGRQVKHNVSSVPTAPYVVLLVCLGYSNKVPQTGWFSLSSGGWSWRLRRQHGGFLVSPSSWFTNGCLLIIPHRERYHLSGVASYKSTNPIHEGFAFMT